MHNILALTDRAVCAYLRGQGIGSDDNVVPMKKSAEKTLPLVIVHSHNAVPIVPFDGTFSVDVAVIVRTGGIVDEPEDTEAPIDTNDALVDAVCTALFRFGDGAQGGGDLADSITSSAGGGWTCQDVEMVNIEASIDYAHKMDAWTDTITMKLVVCPSDVG